MRSLVVAAALVAALAGPAAASEPAAEVHLGPTDASSAGETSALTERVAVRLIQPLPLQALRPHAWIEVSPAWLGRALRPAAARLGAAKRAVTASELHPIAGLGYQADIASLQPASGALAHLAEPRPVALPQRGTHWAFIGPWTSVPASNLASDRPVGTLVAVRVAF
ncbi:MAG TPA: hypothetical protein VE650_16525 [Acetobacteraceae bacterium]|nr:hypothetical protein [Acetobacteraceae bacterium]